MPALFIGVRVFPSARLVLQRLGPVLTVFALLGYGFAYGEPKKGEREALQKALSEVLDRSALKTARATVTILSLDDGQVVFSNHPDDLLNPASNVKLFTSAAVLSKLGPEFRYETEFYVDGDLSGGKTRSLFIRGKGDPSLTTERLYSIVSELQHLGLNEVRGDLVIDETWFDSERLAPGFDQEDSDRAYMAPTGAVSLNWNAIGITLRAGKAGSNAVVELDPPSDYFTIGNTLLTSKRRYRRFAVKSEPLGDKQRIEVSGVLAQGSEPVSVWKKIDHPPMYFGQTLKRLLSDRGVKVRGRVRVGPVPSSATLLYVAESDSMDLILKRLNKTSSNFVAEMLLKTLGAEIKGPPGTFAKGISVIEDFLEAEAGIPRGTYVMKNGSGLNDTNRFSSAQIVRLLKAMYDRFPLQPEYLSSLGIAAKDGTLRYRFEGSSAAGSLRAKTGTLENVSALSGYLQSASGEKFAFAAVVNDFTGKNGPIVQSIDALGVAVSASGSPQGPKAAVADVLGPKSKAAPLKEAEARIKTYLAIGREKSRRNISLLRTAWRTELDPAVRAVVAESLYRSGPSDSSFARMLIESLSAPDAVYTRLRQVAQNLKIETPCVSALAALSAEGNSDALGKLLELGVFASADEGAQKELSEAYAEVARTAPDELVESLRVAPPPERDAATRLLAKGLLSAEREHPFVPALRQMESSADGPLAAFVKEFEVVLSHSMAQTKALTPSVLPETKSGEPVRTAKTQPDG